MTVERLDDVGVVVEDLDATIEFFSELRPDEANFAEGDRRHGGRPSDGPLVPP